MVKCECISMLDDTFESFVSYAIDCAIARERERDKKPMRHM